MMHDFVATDRHVVFFDLPAAFDLEAMLRGGAFIRWRPELGARIGVLPRDGGGDDISWIEVDPFYVFHFLNGWDEPDGTIVVDGCRAPRMPTAFGDEVLAEPVRPTLHRWTIDPVAGTVRTEQLDDQWAEFPRVADARSGLPNRYGYAGRATTWGTEAVQFTGVVKWDLEAGRSSVHHYGDTCEAGEAVFAPDPEGTSEDAGWLLNLVFDRATGASSLVVLDAGDLEAEPVATVHLPRRVPFGFHGNWMADET
jgi:carotenoid cleavage dioxygenase